MRQLVKQFTLHDKKRFGRLMLTLILFLVLINKEIWLKRNNNKNILI